MEALPSEQDRKAIVGCLAAVLNATCAARRRRERVVAPSSIATSSSKEHDGGRGEGGAAPVNFSIQRDEDDNAVLWSSRERSSLRGV